MRQIGHRGSLGDSGSPYNEVLHPPLVVQPNLADLGHVGLQAQARPLKPGLGRAQAQAARAGIVRLSHALQVASQQDALRAARVIAA